MIFERKNEKFIKDIIDEFQDTYNKVKHHFTSRLEKNLRRVNEKVQQLKLGADDFS